MIKRCVICKTEIQEKDSYFEVKLFEKGNLIGIDYAHKICWHSRNNMNDQITNIIEGANELLGRVGIENKKEVIIA